MTTSRSCSTGLQIYWNKPSRSVRLAKLRLLLAHLFFRQLQTLSPRLCSSALLDA